MSRRTRHSPTGWLTAVCTVLLALTVAADYRDSFRAGYVAHLASNWPTTVAMMRQALQERAEETGRVLISGTDSRPYLPSYYLGDALFRLGDCAGALAAFERARNTSAANDRAMQRRMDEARTTCAPPAPPPVSRPDAGPALNRAAQAIRDARALRERIEKIREREFGADALQPMAADLATATSSLTAAEARLAKSREANDAQEAAEAERLARGAAGQLGTIETRVLDGIRRLADAKAAAQKEAERAEKDRAAARERLEADEQRLQSAVRSVSAALRLAQEAASSYDRSRGARTDPPAVQQAKRELASVEDIVNRGTRASEGELMAAASSASRVRDLLTRERDTVLAGDATEAQRAVEALLASASRNLESLKQSAQPSAGRRAAIDRAALVPFERELGRLRGRMSGQGAADGPSLRSTLATARALDQQLSDLLKGLGQQAAGAPALPSELVEGARAFFAARYDDAAARLGDVRLAADAPAAVRLQVHLLRAAALFSGWALGHEQDDARRRAAVDAAAECRKLDPAFEPDPAVFSPRFISFYRNAR